MFVSEVCTGSVNPYFSIYIQTSFAKYKIQNWTDSKYVCKELHLPHSLYVAALFDNLYSLFSF